MVKYVTVMLSEMAESIGSSEPVLFLSHREGGLHMVIPVYLDGLIIFIHADDCMKPVMMKTEVRTWPQ